VYLVDPSNISISINMNIILFHLYSSNKNYEKSLAVPLKKDTNVIFESILLSDLSAELKPQPKDKYAGMFLQVP
jgi:hypothetical protein